MSELAISSTAYYWIYSVLRKKILNNTIKPGQKFYSERELCDLYGVSRVTVRHAVQMLEEQGLIIRFPGKGAFTAAAVSIKIPILDFDYSRSLKVEAPDLHRKLIMKEEVIPPERIKLELGLLKSQKCLLIERLDTIHTEPVSYDRGYILNEYVSAADNEILCKLDFLNLWEKREGFVVTSIQTSTEAVSASTADAEFLQIKAGTPVLQTTDLMRLQDGSCIAVFVTSYRGDRFKLVSTTGINKSQKEWRI